jgi:hypothetical protein
MLVAWLGAVVEAVPSRRAVALETRAETEWHSGRFEAAAADFHRVLRIDKRATRARLRIALLFRLSLLISKRA